MSRSYRGESLAGADFTEQDLRGVDFTGADLAGATFRNARIGVGPRVGAAFLLASVLVAVVAGLTIGRSVELMRERMTADEWDQVLGGATMASTLVVLLALILWKGFDVALKVSGAFYVIVVIVNVIGNLLWEEFEWPVLLQTTVLLVLVVMALIAGILGRSVGGVFGLWAILTVAALGGLATGRAEGGLAGVVVAICLAIISKRVVRGDERDVRMRRLGHRLIRRWGTQFVDADLTGADFTGTDASRCDARRARLVGVTWDPDHPLPVDAEIG